MDKDIERIIKNSNKAELLEKLPEELEKADKVIIILITDKPEGNFSSKILMLGLNNTYEVYGILDVAKYDILEDDK